MATETSVMAVIRAARPSYRNAHDKIAYALHATFLASGFTLTATGNSAFSYTTGPSSSEQEEVGTDGWNELEDCYGFVYTMTAKGIKKSFLVKCLVMGDNLVIDALPLGDNLEEPLNLQINVNDYVSNESSSSTNYGQLYKNLPVLVKKLQTSIINKLENMAKLNSSTSTTSRLEATHRGEGSESNPNLPPATFVTERQPFFSGVDYPPVLPVGIDDLIPGPGAGIYPTRGGFGSGGSMLIGPNDPRWSWIGGEQPGFPGGGIPGVPPGARFDPYGPSGVPGFEPARFIRDPRRPGGRTHPDLEHFGGSDFI